MDEAPTVASSEPDKALIKDFARWLERERGVSFCTAGYGGDAVEVSLDEAWIDAYLAARNNRA